jgi:hypothetical protein
MARKNIKGRTSSGPTFAPLYHYMTNTEAWRSLSAQDRAVFEELRLLFNGSNNGRIGLSVRSASDRANISKDTAAKSFKNLEERGFIECVTLGGFSRKDPHASEWRLSHLRCNVSDMPPTQAFRKWTRLEVSS